MGMLGMIADEVALIVIAAVLVYMLFISQGIRFAAVIGFAVRMLQLTTDVVAVVAVRMDKQTAGLSPFSS